MFGAVSTPSILKFVTFKGYIYKKNPRYALQPTLKRKEMQNFMQGYKAFWGVLKNGKLQLFNDANSVKEEEEFDLIDTSKFETYEKLKIKIKSNYHQMMSQNNYNYNDDDEVVLKFDDHIQRNNWYYLIMSLKNANENREIVVLFYF